MTNPTPGSNNCDEAQAAVEAADRLVDRLQDRVVEPLKPNAEVDEEEVFHEIVEELEAAPEIDEIRRAAGSKPDHFGSGRQVERPRKQGAEKLDEDLGPHSDVPEGP